MLKRDKDDFKDWVTTHSVYRTWVTAMIVQANAFVRTLDERTMVEINDKDGEGHAARERRVMPMTIDPHSLGLNRT